MSGLPDFKNSTIGTAHLYDNGLTPRPKSSRITPRQFDELSMVFILFYVQEGYSAQFEVSRLRNAGHKNPRVPTVSN